MNKIDKPSDATPFKVSFTALNNKRHRKGWYGATIILTAATLTQAQTAGANVSETCDRAAEIASSRTGVPIDVLRAITRNETGRTQSSVLRPWPWTVNMEGAGQWFASRDEALAYVRRKYDAGARSFDVGCFQINYKWHGSEFDSITQMFDPEANAIYAAKFLKKLHLEKNDWSAAAGAYHSRTKKYANRYIDRFDRIFAAISQSGAPIKLAQSISDAPRSQTASGIAGTTRENLYPFFQSSAGARGLGSLVPLAASGSTSRSLFAKIGG